MYRLSKIQRGKNRLINLRLAGGLGNQLFQLSCALRICNNDLKPLRVYKNDLGKYAVARSYELDKLLKIQLEECTRFDALVLKSRLPRILCIPNVTLNDKNYKNALYNYTYGRTYLDGYFQFDQSWDIFDDSVRFLKSKVKKDFFSCVKKPGLVVHARGGDFLQDSLSDQHQLSFYDYVIKSGRLSNYTHGLICCSDVIYAQKIKKFFRNHGIHLYHEKKQDSNWESDFKKLMNAEFIVGSRSTFAWWASVLGEVQCFFPKDFTIGKSRKLYHPQEIKCV